LCDLKAAPLDHDLIAVGTKWAEGCYCLPDAALKGALEAILKNYRYILIDSPAGLEHLNRRITTKVDEVFDVIGPSKKSFDHVKRAVRIAKEVRIDIKKFSIVGGFLFPEHLDSIAKKTFHEAYLGRISYDKHVEEFVLSGNSLLSLSNDLPAFLSLKHVMEKAGY
jgi:CO dehydrogenase maturation factor